MASEAEIKGKILKKELAKPFPDSDVVYHLKMTRPYWNTVDTAKLRRGESKLQGILKKEV